IQTTIYMILVHCKIRQHQQKIKESYSEIDGINLSWLRYFITILLFIYLCYYILLAMMLHVSNFDLIFPQFQKIMAFVLSIAIYGIGYRGLSQPQIFNHDIPEKIQEELESKSLQKISTLEAPAGRYEHSSLDPQEAEEISKILLDFMLKEKPYLNPELTLPELASRLGISRNRLSQVLNEKMGVSFYDFVNTYRVNQVKEYLNAPEYRHLKMLALAFEAGFNSKATFNSFFKKTVGLTPSEYRKQMTSSPSDNTQVDV
ncbi:MAG: helix-turn-helix domain-containing protein, partial [Bacteroidota bacterium]